MNFSSAISLQTTRSGGKGGQNVNKVETAVIASFNIAASAQLTDEQKTLVLQKLNNRINSEGELVVKAQTFRTQFENRRAAVQKINGLIALALQKKKARIATKPSKAVKEKRIAAKKKTGERKSGRQKLLPGEY